MGRKRLATAVLVTGALHSGFASALGLGDLTLASALNQPFRAEIPLRDIGELDVAEIKIALADDSAFESAGVERSQFLSSLEFQVELQGGGNGRIIVTTTKTVQEPYLDFIVEVRWPNGKMNREYTVLLDLPVFAQASVAPTVNVARSTPQNTPVVKPVTNFEAAPVREPGGSIGVANRAAPQVRDVDQQQRIPEAAEPDAYRVQHHDTMWKIAEKLRPSSYVTTQQTMLALVKKNPSAFVAGNVNRIKSGYILRIPSEAEVHQINHDEAVDEIRDQDREWRGEKVRRVNSDKKSPSVNPAQVNGASSASAPQLDATDKSSRETLAPDEQTVKFSVGSAGSGSVAAGTDVEVLRQKIREEQENLDKSELENGAMQSRVVEMEKQIRALQNLITLKNSQLAALQSNLSKGGDRVENSDPVTSDVDAADQVDEAVAMAALPAMRAEDSSAGSVSADAPAEKPELNAVAPEVAVSSTPSSSSLMATAQAWLNNSFVKFIGLGVGVLALLIFVLRRRRSEEGSEADLAAFEEGLANNESPDSGRVDGQRDPFDFDIGNTDATELSDVVTDGAERAASVDDFEFESLDATEDVINEVEMDEDDITVGTIETESVQPQTGDIVAEADIYMAYGRYDQAASLLKTAIDQDSRNADLHTKLIDIYLDTRDRENFILAFAGLQAVGDAGAVARVKESMSAIDGVSDWLGKEELAPDSGQANERTADGESDLDFEFGGDLDFELDDFEFTGEDSTETSPEQQNKAPHDVGDFGGELPEATVTSLVDGGDDNADVMDKNRLDESIRSAEADALASLDVDLADFDFDFEPAAAPSSVEDNNASSVSEDAGGVDEFDFDLGASPVKSATSSESLTNDNAEHKTVDIEKLGDEGNATADEDLAFDFASVDDSDEIDAFLNSAEANSDKSTVSSGAASVDGELSEDELDLSAFDTDADKAVSKPIAAASEFSFDDMELDALDAELTASPAAEREEDDLDLDLSDFDMASVTDATISPASDSGEAAKGEMPDADIDADLDLGADDTFFVDAGDSGIAATKSTSDEGAAIAVEDLMFDEFDADDAGEEFDDLSDTDAVATKLDLARAYVDMGDSEGAREMLEEVLLEGDNQQQSDAKALLDSIG